METLVLSSSFLPLSSQKLFVYQYQPWNTRYSPRKYFAFTVCASSLNKSSRSTRKVKSNEELCNDIREFLSTVGKPSSHVPSMKELSAHGRNDLAYIVRRRGYKYTRQLLESSTRMDFDGFVADKSLAGQDEKVENEVGDVSLSVEGPCVRDCFGNSNADPSLNSDDHNCVHIESPANSLLQKIESYTLNSQNENVNNLVEGISLSSDFSVMESPSSQSCTDTDLNSDKYILQPTEALSNSSLEEKISPNIHGQNEERNIAENVCPFADASVMENYFGGSNFNSSLNFEEHSYMSLECSDTASLEEKVTKFIQNGDLDMIDDNVCNILIGSDANESEGVVELEDAIKVKSRTSDAEHKNICSESRYGAITVNRSALTSKQIDPSATVHNPLSMENVFRDDHSAIEVRSTDFDDKLDVEASRRENQIKVNRLKFMLHQKEMELSRMKEQIEKEKLALSVLQTKAETEINKAQKLISDKDAELHAAEESLSGLEEVEIQYSGDGEIVEVAGGFNGWHHPIKMDLRPSSSINEPIGSRKSKQWTTVLWLYPGIYEIKFIVDGQWKIDPQRESVTKGGICNNILQVK